MRYELEPNEPEKHVCFVGYDKGLETYYVYVANKGKSDRRGVIEQNNHVVVWFGTTRREITTVDEVRDLVSDYAALPERIERALLGCTDAQKAIEKYQGA